jgi:hypothetical protein
LIEKSMASLSVLAMLLTTSISLAKPWRAGWSSKANTCNRALTIVPLAVSLNS